MEPHKEWLNIYVALLSFNSTINGASPQKIQQRVGSIVEWVFS